MLDSDESYWAEYRDETGKYKMAVFNAGTGKVRKQENQRKGEEHLILCIKSHHLVSPPNNHPFEKTPGEL